MVQKKKGHPKEKANLHLRNKHRERYNFKELLNSCPELGPFVRLNEYKDTSIDFSNPEAVLMLNKAILKHFYGVSYWTIPEGYLCPPVPGRADYIHYAADLLASIQGGEIPVGERIRCLDVGVGANCIYPLIGHAEYAWSFVGSDVDKKAIQSAMQIVAQNKMLDNQISLRLQTNPDNIFQGVVKPNEHYDLVICNPPFHSSLEEAQASAIRKISSLSKKKVSKPILNFGGQNHELYCDGGEEQFVKNMIVQSREIKSSCLWFTSLVSKQSNLKWLYKALKKVSAVELVTIPMSQGTKTSRVLAWTFHSKQQQKKWSSERW